MVIKSTIEDMDVAEMKVISLTLNLQTLHLHRHQATRKEIVFVAFVLCL
jgi:hypothetical protein